MSTAVQGVISDLKFYHINKDQSADQWGKTHRVKGTINGVIYDLGKIKPSPQGQLELRIQNGKDWVTLLPGDAVQFFAKSRDVNGKTYWDKEGKLALVSKGTGVPAPSASAPSQPRSSSAASSSPSDSSTPTALEVRIEDGQVFNNTMALLLAAEREITPANIQAAAITVRKALECFRAQGCGRVPAAPSAPSPAAAAPVATPTAPSAPSPAPVSEDPEFNEDDIPF